MPTKLHTRMSLRHQCTSEPLPAPRLVPGKHAWTWKLGELKVPLFLPSGDVSCIMYISFLHALQIAPSGAIPWLLRYLIRA